MVFGLWYLVFGISFFVTHNLCRWSQRTAAASHDKMARLGICIWYLGFHGIWSLVFGIWYLVFHFLQHTTCVRYFEHEWSKSVVDTSHDD